MPNNTNETKKNQGNEKSGGDMQSTKGGLQNTSGQESRQNTADQGEGNQLDQFIAYMKENWKPILTELVTAGVTAYLTHDAKSKTNKHN